MFVSSIENESMWWSFRQCVLGLDGIRAVYKYMSIPLAEVDDAYCLNMKEKYKQNRGGSKSTVQQNSGSINKLRWKYNSVMSFVPLRSRRLWFVRRYNLV
jgi:hypothetical protein